MNNDIESLIYNFSKDIFKYSSGIDIIFDDTQFTITIKIDDSITKQITDNQKNISILATHTVDKNNLNLIVSKDANNALNIGSDNNLYVNNNSNQWKFLCSEKDFTFKELSSYNNGWSPNKSFPLKPGNIYLIVYEKDNGDIVSKTLGVDKLIFQTSKSRTFELFRKLEKNEIEPIVYIYLDNQNSISRIDCGIIYKILYPTDKFSIYYQENVLPKPTIISNNEIKVKKEPKSFKYLKDMRYIYV